MPQVTVHVSAGGRIVIPAELRRAVGLKIGDQVLLTLDQGVIHVFTREQQLKCAQELVASQVPPARLLADELVAERREEGQRD